MGRLLPVILLGSLLVLLLGASVNEMLYIVIENRTGTDVVDFYAAPAGSGAFDQDILSAEVLRHGESANITIPNPNNDCAWDLLVRDAQSQEVLFKNQNLCDHTNLALYMDQGRTWIEYK